MAILITTLLALSERIVHVQFFGMVLGFFDLFLLIHVILIRINKSRIPVIIPFFVIYFIVINLYNLSYREISYSAIVTIPLKFGLALSLSRISLSAKYVQNLILIQFLVLVLLLLLMSDGSPFNSLHFMNRNETIAYILATIFLVKRDKFKLILLAILIVLSFVVQSRQIVFATVVGGVIYMLVHMSWKRRIYTLIIALPIIYMGHHVYNKFLGSLSVYEARRYSIITPVEERTHGDRVRYENIMFGLKNFKQSPLLGQGAGSYIRDNPYNKVAHNYYVTALYESGLIGLFLFLLLIIFMFKTVRKQRIETLILMIMLVELNFIEALGKWFFFIYIIKCIHLYEYQKLDSYGNKRIISLE